MIYKNDTIFLVLNIKGEIAYLKGVDVRLFADSDLDDLVKEQEGQENTETTPEQTE